LIPVPTAVPPTVNWYTRSQRWKNGSNKPMEAWLILPSPAEKPEPAPHRPNCDSDFDKQKKQLGSAFRHRNERPVSKRDGQTDKHT
jgi:hypothetical protein